MNLRSAARHFELPLWWRLLVIAVGALIMCACRAPMTAPQQVATHPSAIEPNTMQGRAMQGRAMNAPAPHRRVRGTGPHSSQQRGHVQPASHVAPGQSEVHPPPSPALPHGAMPHAAMPHAAMPHGAMPHGAMPHGAMPHGAMPHGAMPHGAMPYAGTSYGPGPAACAHCPPHGNGHGTRDVGLPYQPPEISETRPPDEYICDGGDRPLHTKIGPDFAVYGLDLEDTVAHYDTLDGRREVEASNKVCIYAPRFAAVRQVRGITQHEQHDLIGRIHLPVAATQHEEAQLASQLNQPLQPLGRIGSKRASAFRERNAGVPLDSAVGVIGVDGQQRLHVPFRVLATGVYEQSEEARLANAIDAAIAWSHDAVVEVMVGEKRLAVDTHDTKLGQTYMVKKEGAPAIRIIKVASRKEAQPGEIVEFTLRFDNVGDELIGNVTILDNLTTRLEYVEDSQTCTLESAFFVEPNEGESLALRWEIIDPVEPGAGGVITFKCRVR